MDLNNYKELTYPQLQIELASKYKTAIANMKVFEMAYKIGANSTQTLRNCFHKKEQMVSDEILTNLFSVVKMDGVVLWDKGNRKYFVKKTK
jgi:hypothetical protein